MGLQPDVRLGIDSDLTIYDRRGLRFISKFLHFILN